MISRAIQICVLLFLLMGSSARALNPDLQISQYAHTAWNARDGGFRGPILSIAQTPDGYLWFGTGFGLVRFDGVRFVDWHPPKGSSLPKPPYFRVYASRDGSLWIGHSQGLARVKNGKVTDFPEMHGIAVSAIVEDRDGTVWTGGAAQSPKTHLCSIHGDQVQCFGGDGTFGNWVRSIYEDAVGNLWVASRPGVWRWKPGAPKLYPGNGAAISLTADEHGTILLSNYHEIRALIDEKEQPYPIKIPGEAIEAEHLLTDKSGSVWVGTAGQGLVHIHQGKVDTYRRDDGLSSNDAGPIFEDREGNIWIGTFSGLDRFHRLAIPTITSKQVPSVDGVGSVIATRDGSVWIGGSGLTHMSDGGVEHYSTRNGLPDNYVSSIFEGKDGRLLIATAKGDVFLQKGKFSRTSIPGEEVFSIAQDNSGDYWLSEHDLGLIHTDSNGKVLHITSWKDLGRHFALTLAADRRRGGIWLGFYNFDTVGLEFFKDGKVVEQYGPAQGFEGQVRDIQVDDDGTVWASSVGGLGRLKDGKLAFLNSKNGLPCDNVFWKREDNEGSTWLLTPCGLVRLAKSELEAWSNNPLHTIKVTSLFDHSDGVVERFQPGYYTPQVTKASDGRLFFAQLGVVPIDPHGLPFNNLKPPTVIEQVTVDGKDYDVSSAPMSIPPLAHDLRIDYTALSLIDPGKVRFRYKLENLDATWQDSGTRRQAFYNDLRPGRYRFRVIACNNDGVWNEEGATLNFRVEAAWYQTIWFYALCVAAVGGLVWMFLQLRIRYIAAAIHQRAEIRADERVSIARDLHDTLLQGVQALTLRFHVVSQNLPEDSSDREAMEAALTSADRIVLEARNRVSQLRAEHVRDEDLCVAFEAIAAELDYEKRVHFTCEIDEQAEQANSLVLQELYYIGREAVINAFRHSRASQVAVTLRHLPKELVLTVTDNGCGFDPEDQLNTPGGGHWGFRGMKERTSALGAHFECVSQRSKGTSIVVRVPFSRAYETRH